jgi:hypothetical protein
MFNLVIICGLVLVASITIWIKRLHSEKRRLSGQIQTLKSEVTNTKDKFDQYQKEAARLLEEQRRQSSNLQMSSYDKLVNLNMEIEQLRNAVNARQPEHEAEIIRLKQIINKQNELFEAIKTKDNESVSKITSMYADFLLAQYNYSAIYLKTKPHPAHSEAMRIIEIKQDAKIHIERYRQMLYKYEFLLQTFPELTEYVDDFNSLKELENETCLEHFQADFDRTRLYLSKEEYYGLSIDERNQLALDRYVLGRKTKWQIGRDYEMYCGYRFEKIGWNVEYMGIEQKLCDMGRDLIARKPEEHRIVQCKYWSQEKQIHEKHITQLYGTSIEYELSLEKPVKVTPVFMTNINLSDTAKKFAERLGVKVYENFKMDAFPRIKCNVNRDEYGLETKIYHLPFDQQYDRTKIDRAGDFRAFTVSEAVSRDFRRAFRYYGG